MGSSWALPCTWQASMRNSTSPVGRSGLTVSAVRATTLPVSVSTHSDRAASTRAKPAAGMGAIGVHGNPLKFGEKYKEWRGFWRFMPGWSRAAPQSPYRADLAGFSCHQGRLTCPVHWGIAMKFAYLLCLALYAAPALAQPAPTKL